MDSQVCFVTLVFIPVANLQKKENKNIIKALKEFMSITAIQIN